MLSLLMISIYVGSNLFDVYLKPYFLEAYRPIRKGEICSPFFVVLLCFVVVVVVSQYVVLLCPQGRSLLAT